MPKQIGWSNESNLLYQISQQISRLINVTGTNGGGGGSITGSGTANYITRWTSSSSLNNSVIYQSSTGNIGIGTITPSEKLEVNGKAILGYGYIGTVYGTINETSLSEKSRSGAGYYSFMSTSDGNTFINAAPSLNIYLRINNDTKLMVDSSGNVLIGTTTPNGNKLRVIGTSEFISSSTTGTSVILGNVDFKWNFNTSILPQILSLGFGANNFLNIGYDAPDGLIKIYNGGNIQFSTNYFSVGGDANNAISCARVNFESTTQGFLKPRMTTGQINAILLPVNGLEVYNITLLQPCFYDGTGWRKVTHSNMN